MYYNYCCLTMNPMWPHDPMNPIFVIQNLCVGIIISYPHLLSLKQFKPGYSLVDLFKYISLLCFLYFLIREKNISPIPKIMQWIGILAYNFVNIFKNRINFFTAKRGKRALRDNRINDKLYYRSESNKIVSVYEMAQLLPSLQNLSLFFDKNFVPDLDVNIELYIFVVNSVHI